MTLDLYTMKKDTALVIGTSRGDGNTWGLLRGANARLELPIFDVTSLRISYFDYDSGNLNDDFIPTMEKLVEFETIGLVSPVYWYSVSAQIKTFIDRISDLLGPRKDLGRRLRGKRLFLMANGSTDMSLPTCMEQMVQKTAEYLGMRYEGSHYTRVENDLVLDEDVVLAARRFLESMVAHGE